MSQRPPMSAPMTAYNAEMNRRLYGATALLSDDERRASHGAFWGSIHGTLCHILWGDRQWMSRFDNWPKPATAIKQSAGMIEDFSELAAARKQADADIGRWAGKVDDAWLGEDLGLVQRCREPGDPRPEAAAGDPFLQSPDPSSRPSACDADRCRTADRRHRSVPAGPADYRIARAGLPIPAATATE